jgi:hypothetical protein
MERYRISDEVVTYFVTMTVVDWLPIFVSEATCGILAQSLNFCHERKDLRIHAYVICRLTSTRSFSSEHSTRTD